MDPKLLMLAGSVALLWGVWGFLDKVGLERLGYGGAVFWASLPCVVIYVGIVAYFGVRKMAPPFDGTAALLVLAGICSMGALLLFYYGLQQFEASIFVPLTALYPAVTAILAVAFLHERPSPANWVGIAMAVGAVILLGAEVARIDPSTRQKAEYFSSRFALLMVTLGMAVGTGNIWRFPRILAKCGGGAFLIPWLFFLFAWSIPLLIMEFGIGRGSRKGCVGGFATIGTPRWGFLGAFVAFCCSAIMFYYAVVAGWCLKYLVQAVRIGQPVLAGEEAEAAFLSFANSPEPILYQALAIGVASLVVWRGVVAGIERTNKILIPTLFVLLLVALIRSLTLPGSMDGLRFVFGVDWALLGNANTWLEALSQSAWSTGAGWGLMLTYGVYVSKRERIVSNAVITGVGNNMASLIAGAAIIPAVFALAPAAIGPERLAELGGVEGMLTSGGPASTGLTFIWIPALFKEMPGGSVFTILFFLTLFFAALSSLIAMIEMAARNLIDMGLQRRTAVMVVAGVGFALGIPSAVSLGIFQNQDWAWGVGLMLSGLFVALVVIRHGPRRFREHALAPDESRWLGKLFDVWVIVFIPAQFVIMIGWWFSQSVSWNPDGWWNPLGTFSVATCVVQWALALGLFLLLNKLMVRRTMADRPAPPPQE